MANGGFPPVSSGFSLFVFLLSIAVPGFNQHNKKGESKKEGGGEEPAGFFYLLAVVLPLIPPLLATFFYLSVSCNALPSLRLTK